MEEIHGRMFVLSGILGVPSGEEAPHREHDDRADRGADISPAESSASYQPIA